MTLQQWLFSIKGRIGRRDFWIWIGLWAVTMVALSVSYTHLTLPTICSV